MENLCDASRNTEDAKPYPSGRKVQENCASYLGATRKTKLSTHLRYLHEQMVERTLQTFDRTLSTVMS